MKDKWKGKGRRGIDCGNEEEDEKDGGGGSGSGVLL